MRTAEGKGERMPRYLYALAHGRLTRSTRPPGPFFVVKHNPRPQGFRGCAKIEHPSPTVSVSVYILGRQILHSEEAS